MKGERLKQETVVGKQGYSWGDNEEKVQKQKKMGNEDRLNIGD